MAELDGDDPEIMVGAIGEEHDVVGVICPLSAVSSQVAPSVLVLACAQCLRLCCMSGVVFELAL